MFYFCSLFCSFVDFSCVLFYCYSKQFSFHQRASHQSRAMMATHMRTMFCRPPVIIKSCVLVPWQSFSSKSHQYIPPDKVESLFELTKGSKFAKTNSPTAGARTQAELPIGRTSFQFYSVATPNGQKVSILLEELGIGNVISKMHS